MKYNKLPKHIIDIIIERYLLGESSEKIAKNLGIHSSTVCRKLKINNIKIRPNDQNKIINKKNNNWLNEIDSENKAYFLGLMITDGNVHSKRNEASLCLSLSRKKTPSFREGMNC